MLTTVYSGLFLYVCDDYDIKYFMVGYQSNCLSHMTISPQLGSLVPFCTLLNLTTGLFDRF